MRNQCLIASRKRKPWTNPQTERFWWAWSWIGWSCSVCWLSSECCFEFVSSAAEWLIFISQALSWSGVHWLGNMLAHTLLVRPGLRDESQTGTLLAWRLQKWQKARTSPRRTQTNILGHRVDHDFLYLISREPLPGSEVVWWHLLRAMSRPVDKGRNQGWDSAFPRATVSASMSLSDAAHGAEECSWCSLVDALNHNQIVFH